VNFYFQVVGNPIDVLQRGTMHGLCRNGSRVSDSMQIVSARIHYDAPKQP